VDGFTKFEESDEMALILGKVGMFGVFSKSEDVQ